MPTNQRMLLAFAILIGGVLLTFGPTLDATFLDWDDDHNIYQNPHIRGLSGENVKWMFTDLGGDVRYKPLGYLFWSMLYSAFELNPRAYHAANIGLHAINAVLLYFVLTQFLRRTTADGNAAAEATSSPLIALAGATVWAIHPLRVEPVAWACVLPYLLATTFLLVALHRFLLIAPGTSAFRQSTYWQALAAFLLALLSFPIAIGGIAIFLGLSMFPLRRLTITDWRSLWAANNRRAIAELLPFLAVAVVTFSVALYGAHIRQGHFAAPPTFAEFPLANRLAQGAYIWSYYLWKPLLPFQLSPVYQTFVDFKPTDPPFLLSGIALVVATIWIFRQRTHQPALPAFWIGHLGVLVPVLGLNVLGHVQSDRYAIIHGLLLSFALVGWLRTLTNSESLRKALVITGIVSAFFASLSWQQAHVWKNDMTFFTRQIETLPDSGAKASALFRLGTHHFENGDIVRAAEHFAAATQTFPDYRIPDLYFRYAEALYALSRFPEAEGQYRQALELRTDAPEIWYGLGQSLIAQQRFAEVIPIYTSALELHPGIPQFHDDLANIQALAGNAEQANQHRAAAERIRRSLPE